MFILHCTYTYVDYVKYIFAFCMLGMTLNSQSADDGLDSSLTESSRPPGRPVLPDGGATYTRRALLQLRCDPTAPPSAAVVALLRNLGLRKGHRGVRGGRKSHRPIRVRVTGRAVSGYANRESHERTPYSMETCTQNEERGQHLSRPPRPA